MKCPGAMGNGVRRCGLLTSRRNNNLTSGQSVASIIHMNYTNTFEEKAERNSEAPSTFRFKVMVAREFYEKGGFKTEDEAAWECDTVRMWASDRGLCGRKMAYNFPDRVAKISEGEYENPPVEVSQFLARVAERTPAKVKFDEGSSPIPAQSPEVTAAQLTSLENLRDLLDTVTTGIMAAKFSPSEREAMLKKAKAAK